MDQVGSGERNPMDVSLHHDPGVERYLGVRPFDVAISHRSGTGDTIIAVISALVAAVAAVIAGVAATVIAGGARGAGLGISAAAALSSAVLYYVGGQSLSPPRERTSAAFAERDRVERVLFRLPESVAALGVGGPALVGVLTAAVENDWRWAATGFVVGAALPAFGVLLALLIAAGSDGAASSGHLLFGGVVISAVLPGSAVYALWTGNLRTLLIAGGIAVAITVVSAFFAASSFLAGD